MAIMWGWPYVNSMYRSLCCLSAAWRTMDAPTNAMTCNKFVGRVIDKISLENIKGIYITEIFLQKTRSILWKEVCTTKNCIQVDDFQWLSDFVHIRRPCDAWRVTDEQFEMVVYLVIVHFPIFLFKFLKKLAVYLLSWVLNLAIFAVDPSARNLSKKV